MPNRIGFIDADSEKIFIFARFTTGMLIPESRRPWVTQQLREHPGWVRGGFDRAFFSPAKTTISQVRALMTRLQNTLGRGFSFGTDHVLEVQVYLEAAVPPKAWARAEDVLASDPGVLTLVMGQERRVVTLWISGGYTSETTKLLKRALTW